MTLHETMKQNKIVLGVTHIKKHKRDLYGMRNMLKYLKNNPTKLISLGGNYSNLIVKEGGLLFIYSVQGKKIVNFDTVPLLEYVTKQNRGYLKYINEKLWELV